MKKRTFWIGAAVGVIAAGLIGLLLPVSGVVSMAATGRMSPVDYMGRVMWESSMFWRAPRASNPFADDASAVAKGLEHYAAMCVHCHGAPNVGRAPWARGMHPLPPDLTTGDVRQRSDGTLFYVIKHGVKAAGMPAFGSDHSDQDIWHIVASIRGLGGLTEEQERDLKEAMGRYEHTPHGEHGHKHDDEHDHPKSTEETDEPPHKPQP